MFVIGALGIWSSEFASTYLEEPPPRPPPRRIMIAKPEHGRFSPVTMVPYPDISDLPDDLAAALVRLVRLINQLQARNPDLDRLALSVETELDLRAALILVRHVESTKGCFQLMISPWDGRQLLDGPMP